MINSVRILRGFSLGAVSIHLRRPGHVIEFHVHFNVQPIYANLCHGAGRAVAG